MGTPREVELGEGPSQIILVNTLPPKAGQDLNRQVRKYECHTPEQETLYSGQQGTKNTMEISIKSFGIYRKRPEYPHLAR